METITLAPQRLTRPAYFRLLVKIKLRKSGWLYGLLLAMGLVYLFTWSGEPLHTFITVFSFVWPLVMLVWFYVWTGRSDNARIYEERRFTIDADRITGTTPSGARGEIPWSHVVRVMEIDARYLLYISAGQMLIMDKSAFPDSNAEAQFRQWMAAPPIV